MPVVVTGGAENDTFIVSPRQSTAISGGGGNDTFLIKGSTPGVPVNLNGDGGDDTFTFPAMPPTGAIVNVDGGPHSAGDTMTVTSAIATLSDNGVRIAGSGVGEVFYANIERKSVIGVPSPVPSTDPWALLAITLGVLAFASRSRRRAA